MSKLTKRGRIVLIYTPLALVIVSAIVWIATHVWWVDDHYCIGSMLSCYANSFH